MEFSKIKRIKIVADQEEKAPQDVLFDVPQERLTGDVLKGRGPRRGNLERLLRYWRPIMRKPGGFRRCRVILADHPELYPLERICAWLHHETTGLWPNEGCHHPGMKNCRKKMRGVVRGSLWSNDEFNDRMRKLRKRTGKKKSLMEDDFDDVITDDDMSYARKVLAEFVKEEAEFVKYVEDSANWVHEGMDDKDDWIEHDWVRPKGDCGCGCGDSD